MDNSIGFFENIWIKFTAFLKQFGIILLYLILVTILQLYFLEDIHYGTLAITNACYIAIEIILLTVFILIFRKTIIPDFYDFKKNGKKYILNNYIYWIIGLVVMVASNLIISSFIGLPSNEEANRTILEVLPVYSIISMIILAPIIEELMTRVILKDAFKNPFFYMLFSSIVFGSLHLITSINSNNLLEILFIIPYGALGFAFAKIYSKSNNIWTNIFFHALHNSIAILLLFIGG